MPTFATSTSAPKTATAIDVPVFAEAIAGLDPQDQRLAELQNFKAKVGQTLVVGSNQSGGPIRVLVGLGDAAAVGTENLRLAAAGYARAVGHHESVATTLVEVLGQEARDEAIAAVVEGMAFASYRFTDYKASPLKLQKVTVVVGGRGAKAALARALVVTEAVLLTRDLVNEPGGSLIPAAFATKAKELVAGVEGLKATVWGPQRLAKERMGGVLAVGKGSVNEPRFMILTYAPKGAGRHIALVGKGITFDSGGLSIKTAQGMMTMKVDMAGAASVLAATLAVASRQVPVRLTTFIPLVENMPGQDAQRPGDIFEARNGKTVEVLNTDAEGRLVLADALALAAESQPDAIIDMATLTGSASVALGPDYAALMTTSDDLATTIEAAASRAGERVWRMPLPEEYRSQLDSPVADLRNIGTSAYGGSLVAGIFLSEFVDGVPWAHLDVGLSVFTETSKGWKVKGATGGLVRTLLGTVEALSEADRQAGG